jgi:hypothetical protein
MILDERLIFDISSHGHFLSRRFSELQTPRNQCGDGRLLQRLVRP